MCMSEKTASGFRADIYIRSRHSPNFPASTFSCGYSIVHQSESKTSPVLIFMRGNTVPRYCWLFQAGIVGTPLQTITKWTIWRTTKHDPSGVKNKWVAKDFNAEDVIRLMEDEEFSVWCDKNLSDDSLDEYVDDGDELQRGVGHIVDKISYLQLFHNFPLC